MSQTNKPEQRDDELREIKQLLRHKTEQEKREAVLAWHKADRQSFIAELEREINLYYKRELGQVVEKQFLQGWSQALFVVTALLNKAKGEK